MAKKTKKQKILADLRRKASPAAFRLPSLDPDTALSSIDIESPKTAVARPEESIQTQSLYIYPIQLVRKDLTKTIVLSILAISLEVALFFILEKNLVLPFS